MAERPRYFWIGIVLALSVAAACTIAAVSSADRGNGSALSPLVITTQSAPAQPPGIPIGLDYGDTLFAADSAKISAGLADATAIGASWIRIDLPWDGIQPSWSTTSYDWSKFDNLVEAAESRGLLVLATIVDPPVWARAAACKSDEACEPADPKAFAAFAALAAKRYAPVGVHDWEIWNEENLQGFASSANPAAAYTTLLSDTYAAIHAVDSRALVMLGGLGMVDSNPSRHWIGAYDFLSGVAAAGGLSSADAIGVHPYDWTDLPQDGAPFTMIDSSKQSLESVLRFYGHAAIPFWITETGVPTGAGYVSLQTQASLAQDIVATETKDPRIEGLFWYTDTDLPNSGLYFGLRTASGTVKPAMGVLTAAIKTYRGSIK